MHYSNYPGDQAPESGGEITAHPHNGGLLRGSKIKQSAKTSTVFHSSHEKEGIIRLHTCIYSFLQIRSRNDKPETKETGYLQSKWERGGREKKVDSGSQG